MDKNVGLEFQKSLMISSGNIAFHLIQTHTVMTLWLLLMTVLSMFENVAWRKYIFNKKWHIYYHHSSVSNNKADKIMFISYGMYFKQMEAKITWCRIFDQTKKWFGLVFRVCVFWHQQKEQQQALNGAWK